MSSDKATKSFTTGAESGASIGQPKSSGINKDEWLKALTEAGCGADLAEDDDQAVTISEFGAMFGITRNTAGERLARLEAAGKARKTMKRGRAADGRVTRCAAYRLVP